MGLSQSKPDVQRGQFDGETVEYTYTRQGAQKQLSYRSQTSDKAGVIDGANIVGCLKVLSGDSKDYSLLYVEGSNEPPDTKKDQSAPTFKAVVVQNLPRNFVADFNIRADQRLQQKTQVTESGIRWTPHVHVVVSTKSGTCLAEGFYQNNVKPLLEALGLREDLDYAVHRTRSAHTISELTSTIFLPAANDGVQQRIVLLSGDGGIVDITNGILAGRRSDKFVAPSVALLPLGTGNALAHSSGITNDNTLGLAAFARGSPVKLPMIKTKFSSGARLLAEEGSKEEDLPLCGSDGKPAMYGAVVCSWGMHAGLVADSDTAEYRKYGVERFSMAAKEALYPTGGSEPHRYRGKVSLLAKSEGLDSWRAIERQEHAYVLATLVSNLEKTFTISPESRPLSGKLRLVHFGPMPSDEVMRIMGLAYQGGKHVQEAAVGYEDVEGIRIDFNGLEEDGRWRRICVDGKIVRVEKDGWVEVRKEEGSVVELVCLR